MEPKIIQQYVDIFGTFPPLFTTMTYEDEWYQKKMEEAINNGKPITEDDLSEIEGADLEIEQPKGGFSSFKQPKKE